MTNPTTKRGPVMCPHCKKYMKGGAAATECNHCGASVTPTVAAAVAPVAQPTAPLSPAATAYRTPRYSVRLVREATVEHDAPVFVHDPASVYALLAPYMDALPNEEMLVLMFDVKQRLIGVEVLYRGTLNEASVRAAEVFRAAILANAAGIVVSHNHPSGDPTPSREDIHITKQLEQAGAILGIPLVDHIVVGYGRFVSMKERGMF